LLRYCARPPLSLERLSVLADGRIAYRIKNPWRPDQTHRVMTPLQFLARLVALIPLRRDSPRLPAAATLQPAAAWGYVAEDAAGSVVQALEAWGGRLFGLERR
jgi:hypothetical protein